MTSDRKKKTGVKKLSGTFLDKVRGSAVYRYRLKQDMIPEENAKNLKRKSVKAYLLLESLISIALLAFLVSFIVSSLVQVRQKDTEENQKIEALNVAQMAIESHLTELSINGSDIKIKENQNLLIISNHGKEIMRLELQS